MALSGLLVAEFLHPDWLHMLRYRWTEEARTRLPDSCNPEAVNLCVEGQVMKL